MASSCKEVSENGPQTWASHSQVWQGRWNYFPDGEAVNPFLKCRGIPVVQDLSASLETLENPPGDSKESSLFGVDEFLSTSGYGSSASLGVAVEFESLKASPDVSDLKLYTGRHEARSLVAKPYNIVKKEPQPKTGTFQNGLTAWRPDRGQTSMELFVMTSSETTPDVSSGSSASVSPERSRSPRVQELVDKFSKLKITQETLQQKPDQIQKTELSTTEGVQEAAQRPVVSNATTIYESQEACCSKDAMIVTNPTETPSNKSEQIRKCKISTAIDVQNAAPPPVVSKPKKTLDEMIKDLKARGGDNTSKNSKASTREAFCNACIYGPVETAVQILHDGNVSVNDALRNTWSGLQHACFNGKVDVVKMLLEVGADPNFRRPKDGFDVLMSATCSPLPESQGVLECVKLILAAGVNVNSKQSNGDSPLIYAVRRGHEEIVKFLLENGADVNQWDSEKRTPINWAAYRNNLDMVNLLLEFRANPSLKNNKNQTSFKTALHEGHSEIAKVLAYSQTSSWRPGLPSENLDAPVAKKEKLIHYAKTGAEEAAARKSELEREAPKRLEGESQQLPGVKSEEQLVSKSDDRRRGVQEGMKLRTRARQGQSASKSMLKKSRSLQKFQEWDAAKKLAVVSSSIATLGILAAVLALRK